MRKTHNKGTSNFVTRKTPAKDSVQCFVSVVLPVFGRLLPLKCELVSRKEVGKSGNRSYESGTIKTMVFKTRQEGGVLE